MSISLVGVIVGLPLTLAMRGVMGKEKFEEWINSMDYFLETNFQSSDEMRKCVTKAGYDVVEWGNSLKTHLNSKTSSYFLWKVKDKKIVANMSIYDDKQEINRFVEKVERIAGRKIFYEEGEQEKENEVKYKYSAEKSVIKEMAQAPSKQEVFTDQFPTVYVDTDVLIQLLEQYGIKTEQRQENEITCKYRTYELRFTRVSKDEPYDLIIHATSKDMRAIHECMHNLNEDYYATMQEKAYWGIKQTIEEEGMEIEEEEVLEDNSIVLTVLV